jgi:hypothetical protein
MAVKTFTTGEVLTAADTNTYLANSGWVYVTSVDLGGNTAVNIDGCFTATYDSYVVVISNFRGASAGYLYAQTRSGSPASTDTGANYVYTENLGGQNIDQVTWRWIYAYNTTDRGNATVNIYEPFNSATGTSYNEFGQARNSTTGFLNFIGAGQKETQTSDTGLRFTHSGGAVAMNGLITIFGVRKA